MAKSNLNRLDAAEFAKKWATVKGEKQYAQSFWQDFFHSVLDIPDLLAAGIEFEFPVKSIKTNTTQFIDVLWAGVVLIEHKSAGKNLDVAEEQARDYLVSLPQAMRTPIIVLSDFARFRIVDVLANTSFEFPLTDLPKELARIEAVFGDYTAKATVHQVAADKKAVKKMTALYQAFQAQGYDGHALSVFLVRLLFLLFGDDTGMWKWHGAFEDWVKKVEAPALGAKMNELFYAMNTDEELRPEGIKKEYEPFRYVNGGLFAENLSPFAFTEELRNTLLDACQYGWADISPAIFGSMFQTVKSKADRHEQGQHYTSITNILKVLSPLVLEDLNTRLAKAWDDEKALNKLRADLAAGVWADPACGSGNFLIVLYKRLRELELKILARLQQLRKSEGQVGLPETFDLGTVVSLSQFHGIEYDEWSAQIATVAMFLADHQSNLQMEEVLGVRPDRFPLTQSANIVTGNALRVDWADVFPKSDNTVIVGNPPFVGSTDLTAEQKVDQSLVWGGKTGAGNLDYVASWFLLAARHIAGTKGRAAFVSTNSLTQGQQPPVLWEELYGLGMGIDFAHRTFAWANEAGAKASVYCVIVGFSANPKPAKRPVWSYATPKSEPVLTMVSNLNAYLLDAADVLITSRRTPIQSNTQKMVSGNKPVDDGFLSRISAEEAEQIRASDPIAAKYLRRVIGSEELINNIERWGLWLHGADPSDLTSSPELVKRIGEVRDMRLSSKKLATKQDANRAWEWQEVSKQPKTSYLAVPSLSSFDRDYLPVAVVEKEVLANNLLLYVGNPKPATVGILMSRVFVVWVRAVSGRMKIDPRVSAEITYNNFPFPDLTPEAEKKVGDAAEKVQQVRAQFTTASLATLYNRLVMPVELRKAHLELDKAVLNAYGRKANLSDEGILEMLFEQYQTITAGLLASLTPAPTRRRKKQS